MRKETIVPVTRAKYPTRALFLNYETFTRVQFDLRFHSEVLHINDIEQIENEGGIENMCYAYFAHLLNAGIVYNVGTRTNGLYRYRKGVEITPYP